MIVMKFGGTSVGSAERLLATARIITSSSTPAIVVLSAMSGITNRLLLLSEGHATREEILRHHIAAATQLGIATIVAQRLEQILESASTPAEIVVCGELMSTTLMCALLQKNGVDAVLVPALDYMRLNEKGEPDAEEIARLTTAALAAAGNHDFYITQGFICRDKDGNVATLTRGGSDYTATLLGEATGAPEVQIWTDIDGVYTADPRKVPTARCIPALSYDQADTAARCGAKILHPDCVLPARRSGLKIRVLDSFHPEAAGTTIGDFATAPGFVAVAALERGENAVVSLVGREGDDDCTRVLAALPGAAEVSATGACVQATVSLAECTAAMNSLHKLII